MSAGAAAMQQREDRGYKEERGDGGEAESADDGAAERGVLLAAFSRAQSHGHHADDHRQSGHADRAEAGGPGFNRGEDSVAGGGEAVLGEGDHQDGVGRGHAHAHDRAHQRGH